MSEVDEQARSETRSAAPVWRPRLVALVAAAAGAALVSVIASAAGADMVVANPGQDPMTIGPVPALVAALIAGGLGWLARALLDRFAPRRAVLLWCVGAAVAFIVELVPPLITEADAATKGSLLVMHVVVAAILVPVFAKRRPDREA
ncbi:DUF6069 family protein [Glycomyces harbinensis]|uniref:Uncharacterized protein n=1 Tax=Glycomyces harbinensis TaxID=58114 RepID=A0A1G7DKP6_9ACTN|nr:DUF6069 family protein [Glycomyces harbinensis]SDE52082.1 hypothetical protein SAMN05216270_12613 [Glycomyces harbinensis]